MTDHTFDYKPAPTNNPIIMKNSLKSNGNLINMNNEDELDENTEINNINKINNGINNKKINMNINNGGNGVNNGYYPPKMMNIPSINYMIPNYSNINGMNGELPNNMLGNVGDNMGYIPVMHPQIINMRGFIPQMQNSIPQMNPLNQINMANPAINMQMMNNNYMGNQKNQKSKYNMYPNNSKVPMNPYMQNSMYNNNNKNTKNSNTNNSKAKEKEKQKVDIIEIICG